MRQIEKLAPWKSIGETNIFGVKNPDTEELGFVSVMGMWEEYTAVALYLGAAGLYEFLNFEATGAELHHLVAAEGLVSIRYLQASFEERKFLAEEDHAVIKNLGLKFRNTWPFFRSYEAGLSPWFLNAGEVRFLTYALEQVPEIVLRFQRDVFLLDCDEVGHYLVRVAHKNGASLVWYGMMRCCSCHRQKKSPSHPLRLIRHWSTLSRNCLKVVLGWRSIFSC